MSFRQPENLGLWKIVDIQIQGLCCDIFGELGLVNLWAELGRQEIELMG